VLLWTAAAAAQSVSLQLDRTTASLEDELTLEVRASGDFDELVPPATPGFEVTGRSQSSQFSLRGREMSREQILRLGLQPVQAGTHTIGPAEIRRGGRTVARSQTLTVNVKADDREPVPAEEAGKVEAHAGEPIFLLPTFPARPVYVGEPFTLAYTLYVRSDVDVVQAGWKREPDLSGFAAEDLLAGEPPRPRRERIGRYSYTAHVQSRSLVVPLTPGQVTVGAATVEVIIGDIFARRRFVAKAPPFTLDVRRVPTAGRPPEYEDGNIGRFDLSVELRPTKVKAGERVVLTLRVSGKGALASVRAPRPPRLEDADIEALPAAAAEQIEKTESGLTGTRVFQWVVVPTREGTLRIPPIRFGYFDPKTERFAVASTDPLEVAVEGTAPVAAAPLNPAVAAPGRELRDIRAESDLASHRPQPLARTSVYWLIVAGVALLVAAVELVCFLRRRRRRNAGALRVRRARSTAERYLRDAEGHARGGKPTEFFAEVSRALDRYCRDRFALPLKGRTHQAVRQDLAVRGADESLADDLVTELENCDYARFAPVETRGEEMRASLERTRALLARLDRLPATGTEAA
jgi:hypothetical protein